jgi:hypothetical protein
MLISPTLAMIENTSGADTWVTARRAAEYSGYNEEYIRRIGRQGSIQVKSSGTGKPCMYLLQSILAYRDQHDTNDRQQNKPATGNISFPPNPDLPDLIVSPAGSLVTTHSADNISIPRVLPARFVLTDQINVILGCVTAGNKVITTFSEVQPDAVRNMLSMPELRDQRLVPFFSTEPTGLLVCNHLRLNLKHCARSPQLSAGDNVIVAEIKSVSMKPNIRYILVRLAI